MELEVVLLDWLVGFRSNLAVMRHRGCVVRSAPNESENIPEILVAGFVCCRARHIACTETFLFVFNQK
jgi:hypothetical protein